MMARGGVVNGRIASPAKKLRWAQPVLFQEFREVRRCRRISPTDALLSFTRARFGGGKECH